MTLFSKSQISIFFFLNVALILRRYSVSNIVTVTMSE